MQATAPRDREGHGARLPGCRAIIGSKDGAGRGVVLQGLDDSCCSVGGLARQIDGPAADDHIIGFGRRFEPGGDESRHGVCLVPRPARGEAVVGCDDDVGVVPPAEAVQ